MAVLLFSKIATLSPTMAYPLFWEAAPPFIHMASRDKPGLNQPVGISVPNQPAPRDGLGCLASVDLKLNLQASPGRRAVLANPAQAPALYESWVDQAQQSRVTCCLFMVNHVYGEESFGQKLWLGANNIGGAIY